MTDKTTLQHVFDKPPLDCNASDIEAIVADFRAKRHLYNLGDKRAGSTKPKKESGAVKLSLNDLGIKI